MAREYFVSIVRSPTQRGLLAGPYATHAEALAMVDTARRLACQFDAWADFDYFGTCSLPPGSGRRGVLNAKIVVDSLHRTATVSTPDKRS
jgi:hypothetical protein